MKEATSNLPIRTLSQFLEAKRRTPAQRLRRFRSRRPKLYDNAGYSNTKQEPVAPAHPDETDAAQDEPSSKSGQRAGRAPSGIQLADVCVPCIPFEEPKDPLENLVSRGADRVDNNAASLTRESPQLSQVKKGIALKDALEEDTSTGYLPTGYVEEDENNEPKEVPSLSSANQKNNGQDQDQQAKETSSSPKAHFNNSQTFPPHFRSKRMKTYKGGDRTVLPESIAACKPGASRTTGRRIPLGELAMVPNGLVNEHESSEATAPLPQKYLQGSLTSTRIQNRR